MPYVSCILHCLQSSEIMASYGVNVPPGVPVFKLDEVLPAAKKMADDGGQACSSWPLNLPFMSLLSHQTKQGSLILQVATLLSQGIAFLSSYTP